MTVKTINGKAIARVAAVVGKAIARVKTWLGIAVDNGYATGAVAFDGAADYGTRGSDLAGNADTKLGIVSLWFNVQGGSGDRRIYHANNGFFRILLTGGKIQIGGANGGTPVLQVDSGTSFAASGWHHLLAWWDLTDSGKRGLYIDGVDDSPTWTTYSNTAIDYTRADHSIGGIGADYWNGYLADFYINTAEWLDLSVEANREKFILGGKPVDLGADGATPTGTAPIVYLHVDPAASAPTFLTDNKGSGGDFTDVAVITAAPSSPSD